MLNHFKVLYKAYDLSVVLQKSLYFGELQTLVILVVESKFFKQVVVFDFDIVDLLPEFIKFRVIESH